MDEFDLAQRLVEVAAAGSWLGPPEWTAPSVQHAYGAIRREEARGAVVAVLREVASMVASRAEIHAAPDYDCGWSDACSQIVSDIGALADSIEKDGES
jgi:hypothetical protein